ncbi:Tetratricopeptide TPR_4 [Actinokineospora spheciospongiae]|uniref:Tetratricopeptide TPR_4 n=2 Tax=Actinokineospora spheciospongiae TaxID=909613 RepID=W7IUA7_9PSEU|nr:Tetratricopeptide TPR_4 [Actinokineospora spheciospongiae]
MLAKILKVTVGQLADAVEGRLALPAESAVMAPVDVHALVSAAARRAADFGSTLVNAIVDEPELDWLGVSLMKLATAYVHTPVINLLPDMVSLCDTAFALIRRGVRPRQVRDAYLIAGIGSLLLAAASQNLGHPADAHIQLLNAQRCAEAADSEALRVWARGSAALTLEWSATPSAAVRFLGSVAPHAVGPETVRRNTALEARICARVGNPVRARDALQRLDGLNSLPDRPDEVSTFGGIFSFPATKQTYYQAGAHDLLGDHASARHHAQNALAAYAAAPKQEHSYGDISLARTILAYNHLRLGDLDAADATLAHVRALPPGQRIAQLAPAVHRIHRLLLATGTGAHRATTLLGDLVTTAAPTRSLESPGDRSTQ